MHFLSKHEKQRGEFLAYSETVRKLSEKTFKNEYLENKELRGVEYHLDHKLSIKQAYDEGVPAEMVAHVCNLEIVSSNHNSVKGSRSSISFGELLEMVTDHEDF